MRRWATPTRYTLWFITASIIKERRRFLSELDQNIGQLICIGRYQGLADISDRLFTAEKNIGLVQLP